MKMIREFFQRHLSVDEGRAFVETMAGYGRSEATIARADHTALVLTWGDALLARFGLPTLTLSITKAAPCFEGKSEVRPLVWSLWQEKPRAWIWEDGCESDYFHGEALAHRIAEIMGFSTVEETVANPTADLFDSLYQEDKPED